MIAEPLASYLAGWQPSTAGALAVRRLYSRTLNVDVARRCRELLSEGDASPSNLDSEALVARAGDSNWTTPALTYARFIGLEDGSAAAAEVADELAYVVSRDAPALVLSPDGPPPPWALYAQQVFIADQQRGVQAVDPTQRTPNEETLDTCRRALALLGRAWPDMAGTIAALVRELRWFDAPDGGFGSATLTQAFGALFLTPGERLDLYESLVHESSHLELTARLAIDKQVANGETRAPSPFRDAERPLTRVLHATFVCARLIHGYERCGAHVPRAEQQLASERQARLRGDLAEGLRTLAEHANWTPLGGRLFERLCGAFDVDPYAPAAAGARA